MELGPETLEPGWTYLTLLIFPRRYLKVVGYLGSYCTFCWSVTNTKECEASEKKKKKQKREKPPQKTHFSQT